MRFALPAMALLISGCSKAPCEDPEKAFTEAQGLIQGMLTSPATAVFPKFGTKGTFATPTKTDDGRCGFMVVTYVDSQNSFGALVRSELSAIVVPDKDGPWRLEGLTDLTGKGPAGVSS